MMTYEQANAMMNVPYIYYDVPESHDPLQDHYMILDGTKRVLGFHQPEVALASYQLNPLNPSA